jgi:hypothetical protein
MTKSLGWDDATMTFTLVSGLDRSKSIMEVIYLIIYTGPIHCTLRRRVRAHLSRDVLSQSESPNRCKFHDRKGA